MFTPGTELADEFAELKPADGPNETIVVKQFPGSFAATNLEDIIKKTGLNKLVLVGYMAHVCVSTTARQAAQRGYDVLIAGDAVGDRDIPGATGAEVTKVSAEPQAARSGRSADDPLSRWSVECRRVPLDVPTDTRRLSCSSSVMRSEPSLRAPTSSLSSRLGPDRPNQSQCAG